jgi:carboxyl-terminal processing protease
MNRFLLLSLLLVVIRPSYARDRVPVDTLPCIAKAAKLLDEALSFMEKNYYRKDQISWPDLAARAKQQLMTAGNCDDAYAAISWCFSQLNERHSFVMPPDRAARYTGNEDPAVALSPDISGLVGEIKGEWLEDSIGYITVPWVSTTDSFVCLQVADSLQDLIARLDSRGISKWIIDLRKNSGGNCWPMLTGIGPLLGDGVCGYFVAPGARIPIAYYGGSAYQGKHILCQVSNKGYHTHRDHKSIVVLTGRHTVSAGEIVALAFKGRAQTCIIGQPTAGLTTANATYTLSDRSMLVLSVCQEADYTGRICEGSIQPDMVIDAGPQTPGADLARTAAVQWLMKFP